MKLVKSLLLGSAAGLCAVAGAQAADLPVRKAAPVEYVRVCSAYGAGFFYIPGTDTCLRVGGRVRFDYQYSTTRSYAGATVNGDVSGYRALGRLNIDARTQTSFGTLRAFIRYDIASATGGYLNSGTGQRFGTAFPGLGQDTFGRAQTQVILDKAFVQFAGVTAGRAASFFDFYAHDLEMIGNSPGSDLGSTNLFAYTATFGSGFSATLSVEDPTYRRQPIYSNANYYGLINTGSVLGVGAGPNFANLGSTFVSQVPLTFGANGQALTALNLDVAQRNRVPDVVGALRIDQAWGSAQLSAAMHEINAGRYTSGVFAATTLAPGAATGFAGLASPSAQTVAGPGGTTVTVSPGGVAAGAAIAGAPLVARSLPSNEYGFGVQGGLKINLPMIAAGDVLWLQAAYSQGALSYTAPFRINGLEANSDPYSGRFAINTDDAVVNAAGKLKLTEGTAFAAALLHYWTPQWRSAAFGGYGTVDFSRSLRAGFGPANLIVGNTATAQNTLAFSSTLKDYSITYVGANLIWSPVKDLDIGVEAVYSRVDISGRVADANKNLGSDPATGIPRKTVNFDDVFYTRFRVQRDF